jgi:carbamate kinase
MPMHDGNAFALPRRLLIAIGGNAIHPGDIKGTAAEQLTAAAQTGKALLPIMEMDNELIVTHGNGPVVGKILMRQAVARGRIAPMTLDICVAHSQGGIAYLLMQALENTLREAGNPRHVVCLLTQVEVDPNDPAFQNPSKPIGFFYDETEAWELTRSFGWKMKEDAGRGWRHVVPSPLPQHIVDISLIDAVAKNGAVVIAGGGGGIPVVREPNGVRHGVEAVIDKDSCSAHMANVLGVEVMMILTAVPRVAIYYGTEQQRELETVTLSEMRAYQREGHFAEGSMGPKVEAACRFLERGGRRAVIAHLQDALAALHGKIGTQILAETQ